MKKTFIVLGILITVCIVAVCATLVIGSGDIEAPDVSDLAPAEQLVPDNQNAFPSLMAAAETVTLPPDINLLVDYIEGKTIYASMAEDLLKKNEAAFPLISKALTFERCKAPSTEDLSYIQNYYRITILLGVRAVHAREAGQINDSVLATIDLLRFGNIIHQDIQRLAEFNPSVKTLQLGLNKTNDLVHLEAISEDDLGRLGDALASLKPLGYGLQQAFRFKFQSVANQIDGFRSSHKSLEQTFSDTVLFPYFIRKTTWFPGYMFKENETKQKVAGVYRDTINNALLIYSEMKLYDLAEHFGLGPQSRYHYLYRPNLVGRVFYAFTTPEVDSYLETKVQIEGTIRAMQLLVALKKFERKNGRLPDQLSDLTPDFIKSIPLDPFDGKPFRYSPTDKIIYSVSKDLKDSGGSVVLPPGEIYGKEYPRTWITEDGVFKITP